MADGRIVAQTIHYSVRRSDDGTDPEGARVSDAGRAEQDLQRLKSETSAMFDRAHLPSEVSAHVSWFDRFAEGASRLASRALFFALCVALVVLWLPSYLLFRDVNTWQLVVNTMTTIVTFLLVALLQNSRTRADHAVQHKLNAIAEGLSDLMGQIGQDGGHNALAKDQRELLAAVGLEDREGTSRTE